MLPRCSREDKDDGDDEKRKKKKDEVDEGKRKGFSSEQREECVDMLKQPTVVGSCMIIKHEELRPDCSTRAKRLFRSCLSRDDVVVPLETYTRSVLNVLQGQQCQLFPFNVKEQQFNFIRVNVPTLCTLSTSQMMAEYARVGTKMVRLSKLADTAQHFGGTKCLCVFASCLHHIILIFKNELMHIPDYIYEHRLDKNEGFELADERSVFANMEESLNEPVSPLELHVETKKLRTVIMMLDKTIEITEDDIHEGFMNDKRLLETLWKYVKQSVRQPHLKFVVYIWRSCMQALFKSIYGTLTSPFTRRRICKDDLPSFLPQSTMDRFNAIVDEIDRISSKKKDLSVFGQKKWYGDEMDDDDVKLVWDEAEQPMSYVVESFGSLSLDASDVHSSYQRMLYATCSGVSSGLERSEHAITEDNSRIDNFLKFSSGASIAETVFIPESKDDDVVDETLKAFDQLLEQKYMAVYRCGLNQLQEARLSDYLSMLWRVALLGAGDMSNAFLSSMREFLGSCQGPMWPSLERAQGCFNDVKNACTFPYSDCVKLEASESSSSGLAYSPLEITSLSFFELSIQLPERLLCTPAIRSLMSDDIRRRYSRLWHFLLEVQYANSVLRDTWTLFRSVGVRALCDSRMQQLLLARQEMDLFLRSLEQYIMTRAVAIPWKRFLERVTGIIAETDSHFVDSPLPIGALISIQDECITSIETQCFLTQRLRPIRTLLDNVFSCIIQFHAQSTAIIEGTFNALAAVSRSDESDQELQSQCLDRALAFAKNTQESLHRYVSMLYELLQSISQDAGHHPDHPCLSYLLQLLSF